MANTVHKLKQVGEDIKSSWFFRAWALFWIVAVILGFIALVIFGGTATEAQKHLDSVFWWENASSVYYPRFHFRVEPQYETLLDVQCFFQNKRIDTADCVSWSGNPYPPGSCLAVTAETIQLFQSGKERFHDDFIFCNVTTLPASNNTNSLIAWELENPQLNIAVDPGSYAALWMAPTPNTWIVLSKAEAYFDKKPIDLWSRSMIYHSTANTPGIYSVTVSINGFGLFRISRQSFYSPWRAFADIGGFAFFIFCFHTALMIIIGLCLPASSTFLEPAGGEQKSLSVTSEGYTKM